MTAPTKTINAEAIGLSISLQPPAVGFSIWLIARTWHYLLIQAISLAPLLVFLLLAISPYIPAQFERRVTIANSLELFIRPEDRLLFMAWFDTL